MDMLAWRDRRRGEADDLAVASDWFAGGDGADRDLVARRDASGRSDIVGDRRAGQQGGAGDDDAVLGMQANDGRRGHDMSPRTDGVAWSYIRCAVICKARLLRR